MLDYKVSWEDITSFCNSVDLKVKPDLILGIHRGGISLAIMLSHRLNCPVDIVYTTRNSEKVDFTNRYSASYKNILIVDDISDSGNSLHRVVDHIFHNVPVSIIHTLTYARKKGTSYDPTYCKETFDDNIWVVFPWELEKKAF